MAGEWAEVTLADVCSVITDGAHFSPKDSPSGLPMASVKDLTRHGIVLDGCRRISREDFDALKRQGCAPQVGDVLIAKDGNSALDTVCVHQLTEEVVLLSSIAILRPNERVTSGFLRYYLDSPDTRALLKAGFRSGSAIPRVVLKDFRRAPVWLPPLGEQRAIADILGTLDDKVELNRRMSETLETMAQALFRSWFVDFNPVRAKVERRDPGLPEDLAGLFPDRLVDSELGEIPDGWQVKPIGELAEVVGGSTPTTEQRGYWEGGTHHWATPKDLSSLTVPVLLGSARKITDSGLAQISSGLLPRGTVLLSSRAPIGYLAIAEVPVAINQGFIAMKARPGVSNLFLLRWTRAFHEQILARANGSTFLEVSKANFRPILTVWPGAAIMEAFDRLSRPLYRRVAENERECMTLSELRDSLLPKLVSGELRVAGQASAR